MVNVSQLIMCVILDRTVFGQFLVFTYITAESRSPVSSYPENGMANTNKKNSQAKTQTFQMM